jgi:lipoyl(octanoyl) transferase
VVAKLLGMVLVNWSDIPSSNLQSLQSLLALIEVCKELSIPAFQIAGRTGIWVGLPGLERKIAAIGIRVASGVSMHGFAINVNPNLSAFDRIIPCGIVDVTVTSISQELKKDVSVNQILPIVEKHISQSLAKVSA